MQDPDGVLDEYSNIVKRVASAAYHSSSVIDFRDLCQVGDMAVLRAVKAYDPSAGMNIRSFVYKIVKQDIYKEAGRFLGIFTVDPRVTSLASQVSKLHDKGHSDDEISAILNKSPDEVKDLRIAYSRRQSTDIQYDDVENETVDESTLSDILESVLQNDIERQICEHRILNNLSVKDVALKIGISKKQIYTIERSLKERIEHAIREAI